jgi:hypothetical protein
MQRVEPNLWTLELPPTDALNLQYKVLINDIQWETSDNHQITPGQQQEIVPKF